MMLSLSCEPNTFSIFNMLSISVSDESKVSLLSVSTIAWLFDKSIFTPSVLKE